MKQLWITLLFFFKLQKLKAMEKTNAELTRTRRKIKERQLKLTTEYDRLRQEYNKESNL